MSHRRAKKIRKALRSQGIRIGSIPYTSDGVSVYASNRRRAYKRHKRLLAAGVEA
jgi:hypothetical protein